jgi:hypothetical protein
MRKRSILFSLFVITMNATAQEPLSYTDSNPEIGQKKNELSINTAPFLRVLLNAGNMDVTRFSATYKRNLNERSALRFSLVADFINNKAYNDFNNSQKEVILLRTDSVLIKQKIISQNYVAPHMNIGFEKLFGKHKLKWFYGADVFVGYSEKRSFKQNTTLRRDTTQGPFSWVEDESNREIISKTNVKTISIGLSPFFGAKYPISKRFSISAQVGGDMAYRTNNISEMTSSTHKTSRISDFDFFEPSILNDVSLIYKF